MGSTHVRGNGSGNTVLVDPGILPGVYRCPELVPTCLEERGDEGAVICPETLRCSRTLRALCLDNESSSKNSEGDKELHG